MSQIVHSLDLRMNEPVSNNFLITWLKIARHTSRIWPLVKFALEKSFLPLNENHIVNWTLPRELYPPTSRCFQLWQTRYTHHRIFSRHCFRRGRGERGRTSNKHFSPQRPILPFLLAPISSSTSPLLKDPLYIYLPSTRYPLSRDFHAVLRSVFRFATFTDIQISPPRGIPLWVGCSSIEMIFCNNLCTGFVLFSSSRCERSIYPSDNVKQRRMKC